MACDCNSSSRPASESSWPRNKSIPFHSSSESVAPAIRKKKRLVSMAPSDTDIADPANHQNAYDFPNHREGENPAAGGVGPQQAGVIRLQPVADDPEDQRQSAE